MNDKYGCAEEPRRVCHGIRQSEAVERALAEAAAREALGHGGQLDCARSSLDGRRAKLGLPPTTSRVRGRAAGATCPV
jgi:hypothetical protein